MKTFIIVEGEWVEGAPIVGQKFKSVDDNGGELISFYSEPDTSKRINFTDFIDQFTDDEYELYLDVDSYDKKAAKTDKQKAIKVKRSRDKLERQSLKEAEFTALAQSFVDEGILTQPRLDEIIGAL